MLEKPPWGPEGEENGIELANKSERQRHPLLNSRFSIRKVSLTDELLQGHLLQEEEKREQFPHLSRSQCLLDLPLRSLQLPPLFWGWI